MSFNFGASTKPTTTGFSFGTSTSKPTGTSTGSTFSFGGAAASKPATTGTSTFSFGQTTTAGAATTAGSANFSFSNLPGTAEPKKVAINENVGLGGIGGPSDTKALAPLSILKKPDTTQQHTTDTCAEKEAANKLEETQKNILCQQLPKEIHQDTLALERHIEDALNVKSASIQKTSTRSNFDKVAKRIKATQASVLKLSSNVKKIQSDSQTLITTFRSIREDAMTAQITDQIAQALQFENTAPLSYLYRQVERFHAEVSQYDKDIQEVENVLAMTKGRNGRDELTNLSGTDLIGILDKCQASFLKVACQYFKVHNTMQETKSQYLAYRSKKFPNRKKLAFSSKVDNDKNEIKLIESFDDIKVNKQAKTDCTQSPFSAYNAHILANIVKANITKNITNPQAAMQQRPQQVLRVDSGFNFGSTKPATTSSGFNFGSSTNANVGGTGTGFSFGNTGNSGGKSTGFSFGSTANKTSGFSFGK